MYLFMFACDLKNLFEWKQKQNVELNTEITVKQIAHKFLSKSVGLNEWNYDFYARTTQNAEMNVNIHVRTEWSKRSVHHDKRSVFNYDTHWRCKFVTRQLSTPIKYRRLPNATFKQQVCYWLTNNWKQYVSMWMAVHRRSRAIMRFNSMQLIKKI